MHAFADQIGALGNKLAVVLVQLPPLLAFDADVAAQFFAQASKRLGPGVNIAAEPRHASWFVPEADACLSDHRVARVAADPARAPGNERPGGWQGLHYRRLHGSPRIYYSAYEDQALAALGKAIAADRAAGTASWCIFDNTAAGAALKDACKLKSMLKNCGEI